MRLLALLILCTATYAWAAGELVWPSAPRTQVKLQEEWIEFDGIKVPNYTLSLEGAKVELSYLAQFAVGPADPRWNATFIIPEQPAICIGVTGFGKNELLPALTPENIKAYQAGLASKGMTAVVSTADGRLTEDLMIYGFKPEVVEYSDGKNRLREYFIEREGKIFVFTYQAPAKLFEEHAEIARIIIARVSFSSR